MLYEITVHRMVKEKKAANSYIEDHSHDFFHYIYTLSGVAKIKVDNHWFLAEKGVLIMVPPGIVHSIYGVDEFNSFDIKFAAGSDLTQQLCQIGYCIKCVDSYEDTLIKDMFNEAVLSNKMFDHIINIRMLDLLYRILRRKQDGIYMVNNEKVSDHFFNSSYDVREGNIRKTLDYIDMNIQSNLRVSDLAQICGYCENYFSTYFKECIGCSPNKYINIKKVEKAQQFMLSTNMNITQIAEELGFESVHYFSRLFKKILGVSPKVYLNRTSIDIGINIQKTEHTPPEDREIPLKTLTPEQLDQPIGEEGSI